MVADGPMRTAALVLVAALALLRETGSQGRGVRVDTEYSGYPSSPGVSALPNGDLSGVPPHDPNDTETRRPFSTTKYTYHAGVFDVHAQDTTTGDMTMVSSGVFAFVDNLTSIAIEEDFWGVIDSWEALGTQRFETPVLGVDHTRIFHTMSATSMEWPWRQGLPGPELEEMQELGIKTARLSFQWVEAEVDWEQSGLQYLYLEYLSEVKRLNSGIEPRNTTFDPATNATVDHGANELYIVPMMFSTFVSSQGYDPVAALDATAPHSYSRPAGSIFPSINYTDLAPELASNWVPEIGRGVFFPRLYPPVLNHSFIEVEYVNETSNGTHTYAELAFRDQADQSADFEALFLPRDFKFAALTEAVLGLMAGVFPSDFVLHWINPEGTEFTDDASMHTVLNFSAVVLGEEDAAIALEADEAAASIAAEIEWNKTQILLNQTTNSTAGTCSCAGQLPFSQQCREWLPKACLEAEMGPKPTPGFCSTCVDAVVDIHEEGGACITSIDAWKSTNCDPEELLITKPPMNKDWSGVELPATAAELMAPLTAKPKPLWMEPWQTQWFQQRQQWWDAQRKRYRPQVWTLIDRLAEAGIYTVLDFRPLMAEYKLCGQTVPEGFDPTTDMLICFVPNKSWKKI